ncbi:MAG: hypothetical protein ACE5EM_07985 [Sphingomonadales bacterium]
MQSGRARKHHLNKGKLISLVLIIAWLLAGWHVTFHDLDDPGTSSAQEQCQICRVDHLAAARLPTPGAALPFVTNLSPLVATLDRLPDEPTLGVGRARAPPLNRSYI